MGLDLDEAQFTRLEAYERLLVGSAVPMGMVARSDQPRLRERHILDCLRAAPLMNDETEPPSTWAPERVFPASPWRSPGVTFPFVLVEVRRNRAAFIERAVDELDLVNVRVHARRLETFRSPSDVCFARAFAGARSSWEAAKERLSEKGRLIYWAGQRFAADSDVPEDVRVELFPNTALARSGPLVIMSAQ